MPIPTKKDSQFIMVYLVLYLFLQTVSPVLSLFSAEYQDGAMERMPVSYLPVYQNLLAQRM